MKREDEPVPREGQRGQHCGAWAGLVLLSRAAGWRTFKAEAGPQSPSSCEEVPRVYGAHEIYRTAFVSTSSDTARFTKNLSWREQ